MFNIGPLELVVIALVGLIVLGPDRLPDMAKDAARMIRTLRDLATGARHQLRDELGPEFADVDLSNLNPRTAIQRALLGDDDMDLRKLNPKTAIQDAIFGLDEETSNNGASEQQPATPPQKPLARGEQAPFDSDAT
jgi:sec-independent protein translocase protein TatB